MGLDMYLFKETSVKTFHGDGNVYEVNVTKNGKPFTNIKPNRLDCIVEEVAYWRKVNQIHRWFVDNIQDGVDNCEKYWVEFEELETLLKLCKEVKENPERAKELLPTNSGFFFGSQEYDSYYMSDIEHTIEQLESILEEHSDDDYISYYYQSSW